MRKILNSCSKHGIHDYVLYTSSLFVFIRLQSEPWSIFSRHADLHSCVERSLKLTGGVEVLEGLGDTLGHGLFALTHPDTWVIVPGHC